MQNASEHVAVIGGGISGLVSAYRLLRKGLRVTLFEGSGDIGGLGATFEHEGHTLERFYHVMVNSDEHLLGLLDELGLREGVVWKETKMGFLHGDTLYPFNGPLDLLRFGGLSLPGRLRMAIAGGYLTKLYKDPGTLHETSVAEWLRSLFGAEVFTNVWRPLLVAKFGDMYENVPAFWFWERLRREKANGKEVKGYAPGGYRHIALRLHDEIVRLGGRIHMRTPVCALQSTPFGMQMMIDGRWESYDAVVSTLPFPELRKLSRGSLVMQLPHRSLPYQGVVNAVAILKRRLQPFYWNAIVRPRYPFQGLVETTHVVPESQTGGRHLVYLLNYCSQDSETYARVDADLKFQAIKCLRDFNPAFRPDWVEDVQVFRAPFVEPVWPLEYNHSKTRIRVGDTRLYLATTAQCYPRVNSWNTMVAVATDTARRVHFDLQTRRQHGAISSATVA
jgi:protoporphyrinogen oxidase